MDIAVSTPDRFSEHVKTNNAKTVPTVKVTPDLPSPDTAAFAPLTSSFEKSAYFSPIVDPTDVTLSPSFTSLSLSPAPHSPVRALSLGSAFEPHRRCISPLHDLPEDAQDAEDLVNLAEEVVSRLSPLLDPNVHPHGIPIPHPHQGRSLHRRRSSPQASPRTSPRNSPRNSPRTSPRNSPSPSPSPSPTPRDFSSRCSPLPSPSTRSFASPIASPVSMGYRTEQKWLERITKTLDEVPLGELKPSLFNEAKPAMNAWAKSRCRDSGVMVERILKRIIDEETSGNPYVRASTAMYTMAIDGWAKSGDANGPKRAEEILFLMMQSSDKSSTCNVHPDVQSFTTVIDAWAKSNSKGAPKRAEEVLALMHKLHSEGNKDVKPTTATYNAVINAWSKSGERGSAEHAESYLHRMEDMFAHGNQDVKPDELSFNSVIAAWARSPSRYAARKAEEILDRMESLYRVGYPGVKADTVTYNTVISVWARAGVPGAAERCEDILRRMERMYETGDMSVKPDVISYSTVIDAWAKSGDRGAAQRAEEVVFRMQHLYDAGYTDVKPSAITFTAVLDAWARSGEGTEAAHRAQNILHFMETAYAHGNDQLRPTTVTYTTVIAAWARSRHPHKAQKAQMILHQMSHATDPDGRPNVVTYNAVINACAFTHGSPDRRRQALDVATCTYNELRMTGNLQPDCITYGSLLKACSNLLLAGPEKDVAVHEVFGRCCEDGQVNEMVLAQIRHAASEGLVRELLGRFGPVGRVGMHDLPRSWTCSVKQGKNQTGGSGKSRAGGRMYLKREK